MQLKEHTTAQKLRGGYYTDPVLAEYIVNQMKIKDKVSILEPSCGDGVFLRSIKKLIPDEKIEAVEAIEILKEEVNLINEKVWPDQYHIQCSDFLKYYHKNKKRKFDLILGNPPYIRYQYLTKAQRTIQSEILENNGMTPNKLINSWVCFLVACVERLKDGGRIGFVIPAELLQIVYAEQLRQYLIDELSEILLITFKELVFEGIEQEVVVLLGTKKYEKKEKSLSNVNADSTDADTKIGVIEFKNLSDLRPLDQVSIDYKPIKHSKEKWTKYFLTTEENSAIQNVKVRNDFYSFDDISIVNVGITTGNNKYFSVGQDIVDEYELKDVVLPLIGRSSHAHGIYFTKEDWNQNISDGTRAYLINFPTDIPFEEYHNLHKKYILEGENSGENKGYKCGIRERWYVVPSVWVPDAFFLRRNNTFPKFVLNNIAAVSTDTMHRIKFKEGINPKKVLLSYYNSITFAFTEIAGRSYGGGVLEILPREVGVIPLPDLQDFDDERTEELVAIIDDYVRNKRNIEEMLDIIDKEILTGYLGIETGETKIYRGIWKKLMNRRLERK
ncbi:class I SAM-dependent methyltransferase [Anaeromicropila herbilytica]|uniref:DNA methyltransferase n=1 Tax=Anaeromicropila herbilytica TaxID=2785025 RepID=A0A7R7IES1_9FIRM|nr:class I SAM-dependent methyltransferase [Anaeromicropila herbilytica]BCN32988.1 DNA methyltransferase [Anaeromicropila herbilytica]